ncbi:polynucleotide 5'-hydroxyl-kinase NOL9 [Oncorhynchus kisutch]|uniref:Polynucleotide 5'-hydroxyl-kinase NOL9 n=1 Tax=Oncorhynchus kisutch TaxID=8019 RepID=A0A8C7D5X0_ONCKI|nr:polynucleotide 5'-hydroxyl-kinase NOL9 [Oncorhynchus kisutch]XP_020314603.1 polynucleotide 5'-hydroxyl-kinase NOL9 [Oncorhynchus kisutch]XP_020314604.1 polynucleotide 5'-hydroxyl-kinase NOL9 [Oncorhynchus kisutch]XP_020314605.1 polynucleotide 5'-hydroxyl-kinase NOL9 [Oncorhynchus kisutch]XP_020314606.1 polynucleotide 5'-hydroxyl-kinase NOL9 [Oncorhynchus kisutch]
MKVQKSLPKTKQTSKRQQCNDKWFKSNRIAKNSDSSNLSPSTAMAKLEHRASNLRKDKPNLKRLKKGAKAVSFRPVKTPAATERTPSRPLTNGGAGGPEQGSDSDESQDWSSFAKSVLHQNGGGESMEGQESCVSAKAAPGRIEEEAFVHCAERDYIHNRTVLVMQQGQTLCFRGKCLLSCLYGRVEVHGFTLEEGQQSYPLFSPSSHCPLTVTALGDSPNPSKTKKAGRLEAKAIVRKYLSTETRRRLLSEVDSDSCVILLEPLDTPLTRFLNSFPDLKEVFGLSSRDIRESSAMLDTPLSGLGITPLRKTARGMVMSQTYREALNGLVNACAEELDGCPVILVCGAKNVGKSTFNRHLINTLLNHTASVEYLECDLGQTEFTPSGCLSLSTVREPLLGPPFTHQWAPEHMIFYGQSSCETDLDRYLESLKSLWRLYNRETPIVINTMGWVKGFGFQLLVDIIRLFSISHVVQLSSGDKVMCPQLTPEFLRSSHGWQTHPPVQSALGEDNSGTHPAQRSYTLFRIHSEFEGAGRPGEMRHQRSNEQRDLALLGYFSQLQSPEPGPVRPLHCFTPYQVPHSAVAVGVTHCEVAPTHVLYTANASLVGLCCLNEKVSGRGSPVLLSQTPVCPCVGFGVLRGVDMARGLYFLVTPVAPSILRQVNCLLLGAVTLPNTLLTGQTGILGDPPYVTMDYSFELTGAGKLHVFKGLVRPGQMKNAK